MYEKEIESAQKVLNETDALFIMAGAGMGVDSGLPDFRGVEGFWNAYPKVRELGLRFEEMANPEWFENDPHLAWAFYGHRLHLYRETEPHEGFIKLLYLANTKKYGSFVFTSNVDGQFQKAGFAEERIMECHGSIHHLQCLDNCQGMIWSAEDIQIEITDDFRAKDPLPACPFCGAVARPNILMFGDYGWEYARTDGQRERLAKWMEMMEEEEGKPAIIEMGAGTAVATVRNTSEQIADRFDVPLIRINPRESFGAQVELPMGALEALSNII
ncbi:SIR2 family NAD-dependent protein deacylase [Sulfurovum sp. NBC37-1]|uniref:SIR2 family NAD-dependent protein deacylase n=1 Tax=Sulfurovum sp. (strain NBC37-1) TaxID=387093 RepID=UPI000158787E|nr:Sir2 family NAD-dependent protein deacetylase [Sulfurovum sp. NBC37-1]BAF72005.1 transcriptional regulator, Sir2 family [Sulfurovum sp. NBC37-1]